jgi:nitroimidazol reductase NimA-like FMN-containing flavoprotein (pyridoxamine 5'-phosphate oxidase superfamily)
MNKNEQTISKDEVRAFLKLKFVAELATTNGDKPTCSPVIYIIDDDLNFYFVTNIDTYKAKNILENPKVSLCVWEFNKMSVQMDGVAEQVENEQKKEWVIEQFGDAATRDPNFWAPIFRIKRSDYVVYKVEPTWLRALDLTHDTVRSQETPYTEIEV